MRIYLYADQTNIDLPTEEVYLAEDYPLSQFDTEREVTDRAVDVYDCVVHWGTYKRVTFERLYILKYHDTESIEVFLKSNPETEILFHRGHFFVKTWMD